MIFKEMLSWSGGLIHPRYILFIILAIVFVVFSPSLNNDFINWDDPDVIVYNPLFKDRSLKNIGQILTTPVLTSYHPVTMLSFAVENYFFGISSKVIHFNNLLLHLVNIVLVYVFIVQITSKHAVALLTALWFGIHPLRVESVVWAVERKDVLFSVFFLSGMLVYIKNFNSQDRLKEWKVFGFFLLACLSKPQGMMFPLGLLSLRCCSKDESFLKSTFKLWPYWLTASFFLWLNLYFVSAQSQINPTGYGLLDQLALGGFSLFKYTKNFFWPFNLSPIYSPPLKVEGMFALGIYAQALLVLAGMVGLVLLWKYRRLFWGMWFFVSMLALPIAMVFIDRVPLNDRFSYLPSVGLAYLCAQAFFWIYQHITSVFFQKILWLLVVGFFVCLGWQTFKRCDVWQNSLTFWNEVIEHNPYLAMAYNNRGNAYLRQQNWPLALKDYDQAIQLNPKDALSFSNRGVVYLQRRDCQKALQEFTEAIKLNGRLIQAYNNRAACFYLEGQLDAALEDIQQVLRLSPQNLSAQQNYQRILKKIKLD